MKSRFREPGFSKERRLEPQITVGLLTDATGFPLMIEAFEGNKAETKTMLPTITSFMAAHDLSDVTVVADAGMVSESNREALEDAGLSYIIGARIPEEPYQVKQWRKDHPDTDIADRQVFTQPLARGACGEGCWSARQGHLLPLQSRQCATLAAWHRHPDREGRAGGGR